MSAIVEYPHPVIVDFQCYSDVYKRTEADDASFPALYAHASRIVSVMTRWQVTEETFPDFPSIVKIQIQLAICSQIDFLAINGIDNMNSGAGGGGFTVGKVTVHGNNNNSGKSGAMSAFVSPAATMYLEQTGLMYPGVGVLQC
jgi:hypothetical protein